MPGLRRGTDEVGDLIHDGLRLAVAAGILSNDDAESRFQNYLERARDGIGADLFFLSSWNILSQVAGASWTKNRRSISAPEQISARASIEWTRSIASRVALTGGLFTLSDPLSDYDMERIYVLQRCLPPLPTAAGDTSPLDTFNPIFKRTKVHAFSIPCENAIAAECDADGLAFFSMRIDHGGRNWHVVGRFATESLAASVVPLDALGLSTQTSYHVYDFWAREYLGLMHDHIALGALPTGHCQVLAFVPETDHPQLIATTRHVSMDAVSVQNHRWNAAKGTLNFELALVPGSVETFSVHTPAPWRFLDLDGDGCAFRAEVHSLVIVTIVAQDPKGHLTLKFVK